MAQRKPEAATQDAGDTSPDARDLLAILWVVGICALFLRMTLQAMFPQ
jgi:hypothetical protein